MKTKTGILIYTFIILGIFCMITTACKKSSDPVIPPDPNAITDIDGNIYTSVTIGTQVWMVENLKTTRYSDGTSIPLVTDNVQWEQLTSPGYCWQLNDPAANKSAYGALYNWFAVNTGKLAPDGWHVPSDAELTILIDFLGGESVAGGKMKEAGTAHWQSPNTGASNSSGFTALPGGYRWDTIGFAGITSYGYLWSSSQSSTVGARGCGFYYNLALVTRDNYYKSSGLTVRCVKDTDTGIFTDPRNGKTYKTIKIGTQTWMAENLAYKTISNCWAYDNDEDNVATYGYLYNWEAAKNACPAGWHLPTDAEWTVLIDFLGGAGVAGGKMKETGTTHWLSPNTGAGNNSGFTALPAGFRSTEGVFYYLHEGCNWWSSSESTTSNAYNRYLGHSTAEAGHSSENKAVGQSVRCLKN